MVLYWNQQAGVEYSRVFRAGSDPLTGKGQPDTSTFSSKSLCCCGRTALYLHQLLGLQCAASHLGCCEVDFDSVSLGWAWESSQLRSSQLMLIRSCAMGHILRSKMLLENCPVGILAILSWEEMRLKEPHSFNFFFFLSQVQLDRIWPISLAQCCGESVLSPPVLKEKGVSIM